jgi:hypothetical protein
MEKPQDMTELSTNYVTLAVQFIFINKTWRKKMLCTPSMIDPRSDQSEEFDIGIYCLTAQHASLHQ